MERGSPEDQAPTRRDSVQCARVFVGGGLLADCTDESGSESGSTYGGPNGHHFRPERSAQRLYAEESGDGRPFDRRRVADADTGEFRP